MSWFSPLFNNINLNLDGKTKTNKRLAEYKNNIEFINVFSRLVEKGLGRYQIENLPETCDPRVVKQSLLFHGAVCFFEREGSILALPCAPDSDLTMYGNVKHAFVYGRNGFNEKITLFIKGSDDAPILDKTYSDINGKPTGVIVRENELAFPFVNFSVEYADKIADTLRSLDVARQNIKVPYIIVAEEAIINTVKKFFEDRDKNVEYIISSGIFPADKINLLPIQTTPESLKACTDLIEWYMNDYDSLCGLNSNSNPDKKERLLVDEVNANNQATKSFIDDTIDYMQSELDFANKVFGLNMKATRGEDEDDAIQGMDSNSGSDEVES